MAKLYGHPLYGGKSREEWAEDHGYYHWKCRDCGESGWTDTTPDCSCQVVCGECGGDAWEEVQAGDESETVCRACRTVKR